MSTVSKLILDRIGKELNPITGEAMGDVELTVVNYNGTECWVPKSYVHYEVK
jgi:hypothetical protein